MTGMRVPAFGMAIHVVSHGTGPNATTVVTRTPDRWNGTPSQADVRLVLATNRSRTSSRTPIGHFVYLPKSGFWPLIARLAAKLSPDALWGRYPASTRKILDALVRPASVHRAGRSALAAK